MEEATRQSMLRACWVDPACYCWWALAGLTAGTTASAAAYVAGVNSRIANLLMCLS